MLLAAIGVSAAVYLWAVERRVKWLVYLLKPGTMALIMALAATRLTAAPYGKWVLAALLFSVMGDIALMLPKERFVPGLTAFLIAHLCYIGAVWLAFPARLAPADMATAAVLMAVGGVVFRALALGIRERGQTKLLLPVAVYVTAISVMVWSAISAGSALVVAGALLFYASDAVLAWHKFVRPVPGRDLLVMSTYFAAQLCFALSVF